MQYKGTVEIAMKIPKADVYVVAISGGRDSAAVAVWSIKQRLDCHYIFCDTKAEYPELYEYLDKIERTLGIRITRIESEGFEAMLRRKNFFMPSPRRRWCTVELKIKPMVKWLKRFDNQKICVLTGTRADERRMYPPNSTKGKDFERFLPLLQLGYGLFHVKQLLIESGLGEPIYYNWKRRSGCWCCPFQSIMAWRNLLRYHPELFAIAEEWQREIDKRYQTGVRRQPFSVPYLRRMNLAKVRELEESQQRMIELAEERNLTVDTRGGEK